MRFSWLNSVIPIAAIFSFRMLGLFMLIPVFTIYAPSLKGATPYLIGLALGGYGLTQGLLQIPFGMLSDRFGRKPIIAIGLALFALGSIIGALTDSIYGMILARCFQGMGAIGSVLIALLADLTPDEQRTKSMAVIGMTIGLSFSLAMLISPYISRHYGLSAIFIVSVILALVALILLYLVIPTPKQERFHSESEANASLIAVVLKNSQLLRLDAGIFCQHFILTATFFAIPLLLQEQIKLGHLSQQWHFYLPILFFSFVLMVPFIIFAEKKQKMKPVFLGAILLTALAQCCLVLFSQQWWTFCFTMFAYFLAFNFLEASLPSLISKLAASGAKGTAMGVYSSCQFLGIFAGGSMAGVLFLWQGNKGIFIFNAFVGLFWFLFALSMTGRKIS